MGFTQLHPIFGLFLGREGWGRSYGNWRDTHLLIQFPQIGETLKRGGAEFFYASSLAFTNLLKFQLIYKETFITSLPILLIYIL